MKKRIFIGRKRELKLLNQLKNKNKASFSVIRGRRRIGKSRLVEESAQDRLFIKFSGLAPDEGVTGTLQRENFALQLAKHFDCIKPDSRDWFNLFDALAKELPTKPLVLLFDEISWMGQDDPTYLPKIKDLWDDTLSKMPNVMLVLCGSVSTWIDKNILSSTAFVGRIHTTITLEELSLHESLALLEAQKFQGSDIEKMLVLSITGGVPWYLEQFDHTQNANAHIQSLCFEKEGLFTLEFTKIFHDLFDQKADAYLKIVSTLKEGPRDYQAIVEKSGYPSGGVLSEYLSNLEQSGFIQSNATWSLKTGQYSKLKTYRLSDNYVRFYLTYIAPNLTKITAHQFDDQTPSNLQGFSSLLGLQFENLILKNSELILKELDLKKSDIETMGPFFQRKTKSLSGCQIDLLIQTKLNTFYTCEIKLTRNVLGIDVENEVKTKIQKIQKPKGSAFIPVLIYFGEITDGLMDSGYFYRQIDFTELMPDSTRE